MQIAPPSSSNVDTFAPKRRLRSPITRGGEANDAERIAERGNVYGTVFSRSEPAEAGPTLVNKISELLTCTDVAVGRESGGYAPRALSSCTTSASPAGSLEACSTILDSVAASIGCSAGALRSTVLPILPPAIR